MRIFAIIVVLCGGALACSIDDTQLAGKACDAAGHPCPSGLACIAGICQRASDATLGANGIFSAHATWNTLIASEPQRASNESSIIAAMQGLKPPTTNLQLNQTIYTPIIVYATAAMPRGMATDGQVGGWRMDDVPIPNPGDVNDDPGGQGILAIIDRDRNRVWNFAGATISGTTISAALFAVFTLDGPGWWDATGSVGAGYACDASYAGGIIFPEELANGAIEHALALSVDSSVIADAMVRPALPASSGTGHGSGVPVGTLLQLDPTWDTSGLGAEARVVAKAWQQYGAYVIEPGGGVAIFFRNTLNLGANPYLDMDFTGLNGTLFQHMRVIAPVASYAYDSASSYSPQEPHR